MKYETIPVEVEVMEANIAFDIPGRKADSIQTVTPGDFVVKFPDGRVEVFSKKEFEKRFRPIHQCAPTYAPIPYTRPYERNADPYINPKTWISFGIDVLDGPLGFHPQVLPNLA